MIAQKIFKSKKYFHCSLKREDMQKIMNNNNDKMKRIYKLRKPLLIKLYNNILMIIIISQSYWKQNYFKKW